MDAPSPEQLARYREMTPAQRIAQAQALNWQARQLRAAFERTVHPTWTEAEVAAHVRRIFLRAVT